MVQRDTRRAVAHMVQCDPQAGAEARLKFKKKEGRIKGGVQKRTFSKGNVKDPPAPPKFVFFDPKLGAGSIF